MPPPSTVESVRDDSSSSRPTFGRWSSESGRTLRSNLFRRGSINKNNGSFQLPSSRFDGGWSEIQQIRSVFDATTSSNWTSQNVAIKRNCKLVRWDADAFVEQFDRRRHRRRHQTRLRRRRRRSSEAEDAEDLRQVKTRRRLRPPAAVDVVVVVDRVSLVERRLFQEGMSHHFVTTQILWNKTRVQLFLSHLIASPIHQCQRSSSEEMMATKLYLIDDAITDDHIVVRLERLIFGADEIQIIILTHR